MRYGVEFKGLSQKEDLETLVEHLRAKVEKKLKSIPEDTLFLRVFIEKTARDTWKASVTLDVPGRVLAAREEGHDAQTVTRAAFVELERQVEAYKSDVRAEPAWKRARRRKQLRQEKAGARIEI